MNEMNLPTSHRDKSFDNYNKPEIAERVKNIIDLKLSLVLSGTPGLGKTHLAVAGMLYMMNRYDNGRPRFLSAPELFVELRDRIQEKVTEKSIIDRFINVPLLVIDDLGVETKTSRSIETFYSILDGRVRRCRQTIITTEFTIDEIGEVYGDRISSRLCEMGEYIELQGKDYRVKIQSDREI